MTHFTSGAFLGLTLCFAPLDELHRVHGALGDLLVAQALIQIVEDHSLHRLAQLDDVAVRVKKTQDMLSPGIFLDIVEQLYTGICTSPVTSAVASITNRRFIEPYFSSSSGPTTRINVMLPRMCSQSA